MCSMVDYSTMSNMVDTMVTDAQVDHNSSAFIPDIGTGQWFDLFNSIGAFENNELSTPLYNSDSTYDPSQRYHAGL